MQVKLLVSIFIFIVINIYLSAQDKIYTKGLPNGFAWTAPLSPSTPVYAKEESLLASLQQRNYWTNIDSSINKRSFPLDCDEYINKLKSNNIAVDFEEITKLIDVFYTTEENLIIPVLGAYYYGVKELNGMDAEELENYRQELLQYSKDNSTN